MKIRRTIYQLKNVRCPCCSEQGFLCFSTCPNCNLILLICDEIGTAFYNLENQSQIMNGKKLYFEEVCPKCKEIELFDFADSTIEEVRSLGYERDELSVYEII